MVEKRYEVIWNMIAQKQVRKIYEYIFQDSVQNAGKVLEEITISTTKLENNPERFGLDQYKKNNDGSYRYYELYQYRIAFRIYKNHIRIFTSTKYASRT